MRAKWLELNWEVFKLYYTTLDWLQPAFILSFNYLKKNKNILIEEVPIIFNEIYNKRNNWDQIQKNIELMKKYRSEISNIQEYLDNKSYSNNDDKYYDKEKINKLKEINLKLQNTKKTQIYKLLNNIVKKIRDKQIELWQLYETGGDRLANLTLTKSQNITNNNLINNNLLNTINIHKGGSLKKKK